MPLLDDCINSVYEPGNIPADSGATPTQPVPIPDATGTHLIVLDIPLIRRDDELGATAGSQLRHYIAISSEQPRPASPVDRYGGQFYLFFTTFEPDGIYVLRATRNYGAPYGQIVGTPPSVVSPYMTDYSASFEVEQTAGQPFSSIPASYTATEMYDEHSLFMIGAEGRRVLGAFQTRSAGSPSHVFGGGMLLGMYGTEIFIDELVEGDPFVFLGFVHALPESLQTDEYDPVFRDRYPRARLGDEFTYRATHIGGNVELAEDGTFTVHSVASKPPASVNLAIEAQDSPAGQLLSWQGRTRFPWPFDSPSDWDREESEASVLFDVEILDGLTVVRTFSDVADELVFYDATDIASDLGSPTEITFRVYKLSENVGRGFPATATISI